jgi:hypothetical protein
LEKLGFPWILSSEARLINGLREIFRRNFSLALSRRESAAETAAPRFGMQDGWIVHAGSLARFPIFCKELPPEPFPSDHPHPKANRPSVLDSKFVD